MENVNQVDNYLVLLEIRRKAYYRNTIIVGILLILGILSISGTLLFTDWNVRSIWLMGIMDLLITISFLMIWVRYEITRQNIELMKNR